MNFKKRAQKIKTLTNIIVNCFIFLLHVIIFYFFSEQGYTKPREYIVTEWPLKQTVGEFWSLVYDQECSAVVVLCQPPPNSVR